MKNCKDKTVAGLLALFLGAFSAQGYYLGNPKTKTRILFALFVPFMALYYSVIGIIEAFKFFDMSEAEFITYCKENDCPVSAITMNASEQNQALLNFKSLLDSGVITQEEFDKIKRKMLTEGR